MSSSGCFVGVNHLKCLSPLKWDGMHMPSLFVLLQDYGARLDHVSGRILGPVLSEITNKALAMEAALGGSHWVKSLLAEHSSSEEESSDSSEGEGSSSGEEESSGSSEGDEEV